MLRACRGKRAAHAVARLLGAHTVLDMAAAYLGMILGALVGLGVVALPTVQVLSSASSAADALSGLLQGQLERISFLQQNPVFLQALIGAAAVIAPGLVAAGVAVAARSVGAMRSLIALGLSLLAAWALVSLSLTQSLPLLAIAALVFFSALFPALVAVQTAMWAVVALLAVDHAAALLAYTEGTVNETIISFILLSKIDSPDLWRILLSALAIAPFVGALSQIKKAK